MARSVDEDFVVKHRLLDISSARDIQTVEPEATGGSKRGHTRDVIGRDNRGQVENTLQKPFRWVCQILSVAAGINQKGVGTGFVIGRRTILTAAHNLVVKDKRAKQFHIYLAVDGDRNSPPLGHFVATKAFAHPCSSERGYDIAVIVLDDPLPANPIPGSTGYGFLPLAEVEPSQLNHVFGYVTGYPKSYPIQDISRFPAPPEGVQAFQYACRSELEFRGGLVRYQLDTEGGQSGSPLIAEQEENGVRFSVAIGVHVEGDSAGNGAVPLDSVRMGFVTEMLGKHEPDLVA